MNNPATATDNTPLISVTVTVYNREDTIGECLRYLSAQEGVRLDVTVVDDGSTDRSPEIAAEFGELFDGFTLLVNEANKGQEYGLNTGFKRATGEFVLTIDSDYYLKNKTALAEAVGFLQSQPDDVIALWGSIYNVGQRYWTMLRHLSMLAGSQKKEIRELDTFSTNIALFRGDLLAEANILMNESLDRCADVEFAGRIIDAGYRAIYFPRLRVWHDHPVEGFGGYLDFLRGYAAGYVESRLSTPGTHFNFVRSMPLFLLLLPLLPAGTTVRKIQNGVEPAVAKYYPLLIPGLFLGQIYFWYRVSRELFNTNTDDMVELSHESIHE